MEQLYHLGVGCNMPEQSPYPNESKEDYKKRIKKLKAKTSKMRLAVIKKKKKDDEGDIDSDREMQRERDMERLQASAETGGDY